jgi:hypothetical protein
MDLKDPLSFHSLERNPEGNPFLSLERNPEGNSIDSLTSAVICTALFY